MKKLFLVVCLLATVALVAAACAGPAEPQGSPEPQGPPGEAAEEHKDDSASIAKGGALYDKWWKIDAGATEPSEDNPLWALQSSNTRSLSTTWRCKECHGWDYQGKDGAYSKGSHFTGFPNILAAASTKTEAQLLAIMKGGNNSQHDFSAVMSEQAIDDLVHFLSEGLVDDTIYIDYSTKKVTGANLASGKQLYDGACAACHGADGRMMPIEETESVASLANGNPWEILHKIRFGQPGTAMPSGVKMGWSTQDAVDVLGYAQTLPE